LGACCRGFIAAGALLAAASPAGAQVASDLAAFERRVAAAVEAVAPSVVTLSIQRAAETGSAAEHRRLREQFGPPDVGTYRRKSSFLASGVAMTEEGHILTAYAHVRGDVRRIEVRLPDGTRRPAEVAGFDQRRDLALLRADLPRLPIPAGAPDPPRVGQWVVAVGRAPDSAQPTATVGIVSARRRMRGEAVQIDAELNHGNVGGAVVDLEGRLLGIACNVTESSQWGQNSGVGFMIPWNRVEDLLPRLREGLRAEVKPRPYIGVRAAEGALDVQGAMIDEVIPGTPAHEAGLKDGDLVTKVDGQPVARWEDLVKAIGRRAIGDEVRLTVERGGEVKTFKVEVGSRDEE
jgi:S1-C subfamily serine protease